MNATICIHGRQLTVCAVCAPAADARYRAEHQLHAPLDEQALDAAMKTFFVRWSPFLFLNEGEAGYRRVIGEIIADYLAAVRSVFVAQAEPPQPFPAFMGFRVLTDERVPENEIWMARTPDYAKRLADAVALFNRLQPKFAEKASAMCYRRNEERAEDDTCAMCNEAWPCKKVRADSLLERAAQPVEPEQARGCATAVHHG